MQKSSIAAIKRHRTAKLARLATRSYYLHRKGRDAEMSALLCTTFLGMGGVYVKFMQGIMLQSEIMQKWRSVDRLKVFENVDSEPLDILDILRNELPREKLAQITLIQPQPFAAGSFGQVYYGQHQDGTAIIIKVLRPMIRELLKYDLKLLTAFAKAFFLRMHQTNVTLDFDTAIKEFKAATMRETDYIEEARFAAELYEHYKGHPKLIIPRTYLELCTNHIIVQEYIGGISGAQILKMQEQGVEPRVYVKEQVNSDLDEQLVTLGFESLVGIFNMERIAGDPHAGNVRFLTDNQVGLIDFGISAHTPPDRAAFFGIIVEWSRLFSDNQSIVGLFESFMRFFVSDLYRALRKLSNFMRSPEKTANFTQEVSEIAQHAFAKVTGENDIAGLIHDGRIIAIINRIVNKGNRFGLVIKLEASEILRASQTYINLVDGLGRRTAVLPRVFAEVVKQVDQDHPELRYQTEEGMSISDALEIVSSWLGRVAERDPQLFQEITSRIRLNQQSDI